MIRTFAAVVLSLVLCSSAFAWSYKEHIQLTRLAALRLIDDPATPPDLKEFLRTAVPDLKDLAAEKEFFLNASVGRNPSKFTGLSYWSMMPDYHAEHDSKDVLIQPFNAPEKSLHYLDLEFFKPGLPLPQYRPNLSARPDLKDIPRDIKDARYRAAGMLPFRVEDCCRRLVAAIRDKRLTHGDADDHAVRWAGYLAHYAADNTQPHHSTVDYKSVTYVPQHLKAPNVHMQMEYVMADDPTNNHMPLRQEYWPMLLKQIETFHDPIKTDDPWQATVEVLLTSYDALPLIGQAAQAATRPDGQFDTEAFFHFKGTYRDQTMTVLELKARQQAWAVHRIQRLFLQAWLEAAKQ